MASWEMDACGRSAHVQVGAVVDSFLSVSGSPLAEDGVLRSDWSLYLFFL